jgi:hypothetical protein
MSVVRTYFDIVARWRWSLLLALLIGAFILQALLEKTGISRLAGLVLFVMIFAGAIHAGRVGPIAKRSALVCLVLAPLLQLLVLSGAAWAEGPLTFVTLLIVLVALVATFAELVSNRDATADSLVGAIFGYFVIAAACGILFRQMEVISPGTFRLPEGGDLDTQMMYFSLITLTTAGYGDITPATSIAQICAALEAAIGTFYIAILIGRIVGQLAPGVSQPPAGPAVRLPTRDVLPVAQQSDRPGQT